MKKWILYFILFYSFNGLVCAQQTSYLNHGFSYHPPFDYLPTQLMHVFPTNSLVGDTCFVLGSYFYNSNDYHVFFEKYDLNNGVFIDDSTDFLLDSIGYNVKYSYNNNYSKINDSHFLMMAFVDKITNEKDDKLLKLNLESKTYKDLGSVLQSNIVNGVFLDSQNNHLIAIGQDFKFNGYTPNFSGRIFISKLDTLGNIISTLYSNHEVGANVLLGDYEEVNSGYIISGVRQTSKFLPDPVGTYAHTGVAVLLRNNGTQKVLKVGNENLTYDLPLLRMARKNDTEILIRTCRRTKFERYAPIKDAIMCIDTALNIKWIQNLDSTEQDKGIGDLIKTQDGNYVINGNDLNHELNEQVAETYQHLFRKHYLQKIDSTGKFIWKRNIIYNELFTIQVLGYITELPNGDLLMPGMLFDQLGIVETPLQKMWIVRTDKYGCLVPGCEMYDDIDEKEANQIRLSLYPNPVVNELYVFNPTHAHSYKGELISLNGQVVKSNIFLSPQSTTIIPLSGLKSGIYILKCSDEKGNVQTHKIIKN